jgi:hypothetical protein
MRRISLAVALIGAVAAAGCGGGAKPASTATAKGVSGNPFTVTVVITNANNGNSVASADGNINCSAAPYKSADGKSQVIPPGCSFQFPKGTSLPIVLTATKGSLFFNGWYGDCSGALDGTGAPVTCSLSGPADAYVVANFSDTQGIHPNFADASIHGPAYWAFRKGTSALVCTDCHGSALEGAGIASSCSACHNAPPADPATPFVPGPLGGHFNSAGALGGHSTGTCSRCHNSEAFRAFIGDPTVTGGDGLPHLAEVATFTFSGTTKGMVCVTCHNSVSDPTTGTLRTHQFPSGKVVTTDAKTAICSQCHDGGRPAYEVAQLNKQLTLAPVPATVDAQLTATGANKTVRAHYLPAASTLFGADASNWAEYAGNIYTARNQHGGVASCVDCHDAHNGDVVANVKATTCGKCHFNELTLLPVANFAELEESRQFGFEGDIDGDGVVESLKLEIDGLRAKLLTAIQSYATNVVGTAICFDNSATNPNRFYLDDGTSVNGRCGAQVTEYNKYTPRLLKAAYNYMIATNDVGAWAHNPRYAIEVIYDTIADLNVALAPAGKQVANGKRAFNGHFGAADAASPYAAMIYHGGSNAVTGEVLPSMGFTSAACYQCHGGKVGLDTYLAGAPAAIAAIPAGGKVSAFQCSTCHVDGGDMTGLRSDIKKVYFPPQKAGAASAGEVIFEAANLPKTFAICGTCHSARENKKSIDNKNLVNGTFSTTLVNPHYLGAAATVMGTRTKSWYEYDGKAYTAFPAFWKAGTNGDAPGPHGSPHGADCVGCHQAKESKHSFEVDYAYCGTCHAGNYALAPKEEEYTSMKAELLAALDAYAAANLTAFQTANGADATGICYDGNVYGYVLVKKAAGCSTTGAKLDGKAMKAGYNLHWMNKDPGGWAHNEYYVMQLVYDSIVDLGGTPSFKVCAATDATRACIAGDPLNRGY